MRYFSNLPHVKVGEEPRRRTRHDNRKKNQGTITYTDSTATKTTASFTSNWELEWDEYTVDGITEPSTLSYHTYVWVWDKKMGETCL